ncbi:MAG: DUF350 domain-containing protein [Syntrophothermus sp.]
MDNFLVEFISSVVFAVIGFVLGIVGYKLFDWATPGDLGKEISNGNIAAGVTVAGIFVAVALIVAAAIR